MPAVLSILGLYNFDPSIFDDFKIPLEMDKQTLTNNLLMECAEFEILYTDPDFMKMAISTWSDMMLPIWEKLLSTTKYVYDPISNYDRNEEYTDKITGTQNSTRTPNLKSELANGLVNVQAQNSYENAGMVDAYKSTNSGKDVTTQTGDEKISNSDSRDITHKAHLYGNIGVTTTQEMIEQERKSVLFNLCQVIISDFQKRFCLMIY